MLVCKLQVAEWDMVMSIKKIFNGLKINTEKAGILLNYGDDNLHIIVEDSVCRIKEQGVKFPDIELSMDKELVIDIFINKKVSLIKSFLFGKIQVYGDLSLLVHISDGLKATK